MRSSLERLTLQTRWIYRQQVIANIYWNTEAVSVWIRYAGPFQYQVLATKITSKWKSEKNLKRTIMNRKFINVILFECGTDANCLWLAVEQVAAQLSPNLHRRWKNISALCWILPNGTTISQCSQWSVAEWSIFPNRIVQWNRCYRRRRDGCETLQLFSNRMRVEFTPNMVTRSPMICSSWPLVSNWIMTKYVIYKFPTDSCLSVLALVFMQVPGLREALAIPYGNVTSIYSPKYVNRHLQALEKFEKGNIVFTFPASPVKCPGAPQKICYITEHYLRRTNKRQNAKIIYNTALPVIFGVKYFADALWKVVKQRNIDVNLKTNLIEVIPDKNIAIFANVENPSERHNVEVSRISFVFQLSNFFLRSIQFYMQRRRKVQCRHFLKPRIWWMKLDS